MADPTSQPTAPTPEQFAHFVAAFERLSYFEASMRFSRGWGAFKEEELPIPGAIDVLNWLKEKANA